MRSPQTAFGRAVLALCLAVTLGVASMLYLTKSLHRAPYYDIHVFEERDGSIGASSSPQTHSRDCGTGAERRLWQPYHPFEFRLICVDDFVDDDELAAKSALLHWLAFVDATRTTAQMFIPAILAAMCGLLAAALAFAARALVAWVRSAPGG